ncbi:MAG TPA: peptide chain release factor N(5)-glutamine methyltransferase [Candidatus Paceibacterota bacterium]
MTDQDLLIRDKYAGDQNANLTEDLARLEKGEPLAYIIGWVPFLGLRIGLDSRPLIPRPETEWWTEALCARLEERFKDRPFSLLDLCAGSGAIGLSVLARFPNAKVTFAELVSSHVEQIKKNIEANGLDADRATMYQSDLFEAIVGKRFDIVATNPPYIPSKRTLDASVTTYEPTEALFADEDGLSVIRRIAEDAPAHINEGGELWMECDIDNIEEARELLLTHGAKSAEIRTDLYGRPRVAVGYYK